MTSQDARSSTLQEEFNLHVRDPRMAQGLGANAPAVSQLTCWMLSLIQPERTEHKLLYGWILPSPARKSAEWSVRQLTDKRSLGSPGGNYRISRLSLLDRNETLLNLILALSEGRTLTEACVRLGLKPPPKGGELRLAPSEAAAGQMLAAGPIVFLETGGVVSPLRPELQPPVSPNSEVPAYSTSLILLDKSWLWTRNEQEPWPIADDLAKDCCLLLGSETGLDFRHASASRLGNIEWLAFPAMAENEKARVSIKCRGMTSPEGQELEAFDVTLPADAPSSGQPLLVRCRVESIQGVVFDECRLIQPVGPSVIRFENVAPEGRALIEIWTRENESAPWRPWFSHDYIPIREFHINMGLVGLQGSIDSPWLKNLEKTRAKDRAARVRRLHQVSYRPVRAGKPQGSRLGAAQAARALTRRLFPEKSGGGFFPKGWEGEGRLNFAAWLRSLTDSAETKRLLLIDPYFDESGVELFARAIGTQIDYAVLTCAQKRGEEEEGAPEEANTADGARSEPPRAIRLKNACDRLSVILQRLRFTLYDLRSTKGGTKQLFHDRYLLTFDESGDIASGFHLSNSLQGLTKKHPLLVTPIPSDLLEPVGQYVSALLAAEAPTINDAKVVELFSSRAAREADRAQPPVQASSSPGLFLATVLGDASLENLEPSALKARLAPLGLDLAHSPAPEVLRERLPQFTTALLGADPARFAMLWDSFGEWLAHTPRDDKFLRQIEQAAGAPLIPQLERYLLATVQAGGPLDPKKIRFEPEVAGYGHLFVRPFLDVLDDAESLLRYPRRSYRWRHYGVMYAVEALLQKEPSCLFACAHQLWESIPQERRADALVPEANAILQLLMLLAEKLTLEVSLTQRPELLRALLTAPQPLFRALGVHALVRSESPLLKTDREQAFALLRPLASDEHLHALAELVHGLRIQANRNGGEEEAVVTELRQALFQEMISIWPAGMDVDGLRALVRRQGGPLEGSWSNSTTKDLLYPLVEKGKLEADAVTNLWLTLLTERIDSNVDSGGDSKAQGTEGHHYFASTDAELTETCAWALVNATPELRQTWLKRLSDLSTTAARLLRRPLARSINYTQWRQSLDALLWLQAFQGLFWLHSSDAKMDEASLEEALKAYDLLEEVMKPSLDGELFVEQGLTALRTEVGEALHSRRAGAASPQSPPEADE